MDLQKELAYIEELRPNGFRGQLKGVDKPIVALMLKRQKEQGNERSLTTFEFQIDDSVDGFNWSFSKEGDAFWAKILRDKDFKVFYKRYPELRNATNTKTNNKKQKQMKEVFHNFHYKGRIITICILYNKNTENMRAGYAVRMPIDDPIKIPFEGESRDKGEVIAIGRARNKNMFPEDLTLDKRIANTHSLTHFAESLQWKIENDVYVIKGIQNNKR